MRAIYLAPALLLSALAFAPAQAAPLAPVSGLSVEQPIVLAQYHRDKHPHYVAGHRYRSAPHGWHRYSRRPGDWNRRGCVLVGPVWFCP